MVRRGRAPLRTSTARAGEDPTDGPRSERLPVPGGEARAAHPAAARRPRALGLHPSHLPVGVLLDQDEHGDAAAHEHVHPLRPVDGFPCVVDGKADAQAVCVDPALRAPEPRARHQRQGRPARDRRRRPQVTAVVATMGDGSEARFSGDVVVVACGALNSALLLLRSANDAASERPRQRLRPGGPQLHAPQQRGPDGAVAASRTPRGSRRRSP